MIDLQIAKMGLGHPVGQWMQHAHSSGLIGSNLEGLLSSLTLGVASFLIVFFGGIFLAAQPRLYGIGLIRLIPAARRRLVAEAMEESDRALRLWLKGQLWAMIAIFLMTWAGLWLLGVPSALVLALISGVLEFIPYAGAITSSVPAIMVAMVRSPELALWVVGLYVVVHHVEAYLVQPVIQQFAVEIPAVITLFSLLAFGLLFGFLGVLLAAPLAVVSYVLVKRFVHDRSAQTTATSIPGENKDTATRDDSGERCEQERDVCDPGIGQQQNEQLDLQHRILLAEQWQQHELRDIVDGFAERRASFKGAVMCVAVDDGLHVVEAVDWLAQALGTQILMDGRRLSFDCAEDRGIVQNRDAPLGTRKSATDSRACGIRKALRRPSP